MVAKQFPGALTPNIISRRIVQFFKTLVHESHALECIAQNVAFASPCCSKVVQRQVARKFGAL